MLLRIMKSPLARFNVFLAIILIACVGWCSAQIYVPGASPSLLDIALWLYIFVLVNLQPMPE